MVCPLNHSIYLNIIILTQEFRERHAEHLQEAEHLIYASPATDPAHAFQFIPEKGYQVEVYLFPLSALIEKVVLGRRLEENHRELTADPVDAERQDLLEEATFSSSREEIQIVCDF